MVIAFNTEKLIKYDLGMSMGAILVTDAHLPWSTIDLVYVIPPAISGQAWVLYNPNLIGKTITGHTPPSHSGYASALRSNKDVPQGSGSNGCGWSECPCCKSLNPDGFASCLNCRVKFPFDHIAEVSKVAQRSGEKSGSAGSASSSSDTEAMRMVSADAAAKEAIRIAKLQLREDKQLKQSFRRPGDILWELVSGNMKWRLRYDSKSYAEQQESCSEGKSRFCAGENFDKFHLDAGKGGKGLGTGEKPGPRPVLEYGGAKEYLIAQATVLSDKNDPIAWVLHEKIYIVGVLVDMIEEMCPWSIESLKSILSFKKNIHEDSKFMKAWHKTLGELLEEQQISLEKLMTAEMLTERSKHEEKAQAAQILRKPEATLTADDLKLIEKRIVKSEIARESPSSSSSGPCPGKGNRVEDDANKGRPRAAPAVERIVPEAPVRQPPNIPPANRRPIPLIVSPDPPAKQAKGAPKGAAERAPSGSKGAQKGAAIRAESASSSGKGKGKGKWEGKGKPKGGRARTPPVRPYSWTPPRNENFDHLPAPPLLLVEHAPDRRFDGGERIPIQRNAVEDFREVDRRRLENAAALQRGAPTRDPSNAAYREWHENAWTGQHLAPPAENRYYRKNAGYQAEYRGRDEGWHPTLPQTLDW